MKILIFEETKIRPLKISDLDNLMTWINDPEIVGRYAYFSKPFTREEEAVWLKYKINSDVDFFYAIENKNEEYLGNVAIEKIHWPSKHGMLSITIGNKKERGKGHGQRAIKLILDRAFNEYRLHKVYLYVAEDNIIGRHIYEKIGFIVEGNLRDHYIINGKYVNMYFMSILENEFKEENVG
ncbi:MAG: GNAT family N-acetyltransferase [Promethearchaeota archaeon]